MDDLKMLKRHSNNYKKNFVPGLKQVRSHLITKNPNSS